MSGWHSDIGPWLFGAVLVYLLYLRVRRQFVAQPVRPWRMGLRMALLLALAGGLCPLALASPRLALGMLAALAVGIALGAWAALHTRLERSSSTGGVQYVPHLYAGLVVTALVIGRVAYRLAVAPERLGAAPPGARANLDSVAANPTTLALLFVLVGYYVCYYGWVLLKAKRLGEADGPAPKPE